MAEVGRGVNPLFLRSEALLDGLVLLHGATRALDRAVAETLAHYDLGQAQFRLLFVAYCYPDAAQGDLMAWLGVSKQALGRVQRDLEAAGLIAVRPARADRRQRLTRLTESGHQLAETLVERQMSALADAYRASGAEAVRGFETVLRGLSRSIPRPERHL